MTEREYLRATTLALLGTALREAGEALGNLKVLDSPAALMVVQALEKLDDAQAIMRAGLGDLEEGGV